MAPEIIKGKEYNGIKADIWSFGVTAHVIMTRELPFEYYGEAKYIQDVKRGNIQLRSYCGGDLAKLFASCLESDPEKRPSTSELLDNLNKIMNELNISKSFQTPVKKLITPDRTFNKSVPTRNLILPLTGKIATPFKLRKIGSL